VHRKHDIVKSAKICVNSKINDTFLSIKPTYFYDQLVTDVISVTTVIMATLVVKVATDFVVITFNVVTNVPIVESGLRHRSTAARLLGLGLNPAGGMDVCLPECCVSSSISFCNQQITSPEESYRLWCA
jgi:hypothetical protein